jgi:hypothetical protein
MPYGSACRAPEMGLAKRLADARQRAKQEAGVLAAARQGAVRIQGEEGTVRLDAARNVNLFGLAALQRFRFDRCRSQGIGHAMSVF